MAISRFLLIALVLGLLSTGCSDQPDNPPSPERLSSWAVALCSRLRDFNTATSPLEGSAMQSVEEMKNYAGTTVATLSASSKEASEAMGRMTPPAAAVELHQSVKAQLDSIGAAAGRAKEKLPRAQTVDEIKTLVLTILIAAERKEDEIAEELAKVDSETRAALKAVGCPLVSQDES